jgi:outer membrane autotransporter protein
VNAIEYDNSFTQDHTAISLGLDLIERHTEDMAFVVGAMIGYGRGRIHFDESINTATMTGFNGGLYGSFTAGEFFVDGVVSGAWTDVDFDVPTMNLFPDTTILDTDIQVIGGRLEAGWRMQVTDVVRIEPLAGLTYQSAEVDQLSVPADDPDRLGGEVTWDDATSLRGSLGFRLSAENFMRLAPTTRVSLTARQVQEFEGESLVSIVNVGGIDAPANDTLDGAFTEVALSLTLGNASQTAAGFLNVGGTFADQYEATSVSAGFRYQW